MNSPFEAHYNHERGAIEETDGISRTANDNYPPPSLQPGTVDSAEMGTRTSAENDLAPATIEATGGASKVSPTQAANSEVEFDTTCATIISKVLVVDDLPVNRKLIGIQLQKLGYIVEQVDNGLAAVEKVKAEEYALVFMDLEMPIMDGYKAAIEIRQFDLETRQHTPIVGLSSYSHQTERERCISSGMDELISKGINSKKLKDVVKKLARQESQRKAPDTPKTASKAHGVEIDFQLLHETAGKIDESVIDLSLGSMKTFIGCLKCALEDRDLINIKHFAQELKAPCVMLGLKSMNKLSVRILSDVVKGNWSGAAQGMALMELQYSQILDQLTGFSATLHRVDDNSKA
jgi:CheY-like chemotaxis protein